MGQSTSGTCGSLKLGLLHFCNSLRRAASAELQSYKYLQTVIKHHSRWRTDTCERGEEAAVPLKTESMLVESRLLQTWLLPVCTVQGRPLRRSLPLSFFRSMICKWQCIIMWRRELQPLQNSGVFHVANKAPVIMEHKWRQWRPSTEYL